MFQNSAKCLERVRFLGSPSKVPSKLVSRLIKFHACLNANITFLTLQCNLIWNDVMQGSGFSAETQPLPPRGAEALDHLSKGRKLTASESQGFTRSPQLVCCMLISGDAANNRFKPSSKPGGSSRRPCVSLPCFSASAPDSCSRVEGHPACWSDQEMKS